MRNLPVMRKTDVLAEYGGCFLLRSFLAAAILIAVILSSEVAALPAGKNSAEEVARGWLARHRRPFNTDSRRLCDEIETYNGTDGEALYYVVYLEPSGFVVVPADDEVTPIICYAEKGRFDPGEDRPLGALVSRDLPRRIGVVRRLHTKQSVQRKGLPSDEDRILKQSAESAQNQWAELIEEGSGVSTMGFGAVPDVRVEPLLQSEWGQTTVGDYVNGISLYNYYTPPYGSGNSNNYPVGCVANSMAQIMRYHEWPATYVWSNMPLIPDQSITLMQRQAIGDLCYDAAESINTNYGPVSTGGSSASPFDASARLQTHFGYGNSVYTQDQGLGDSFRRMVNPNLDAGNPVMLSLDGPYGGHAVVCDGYGYTGATLYHHLNMGWSGNSNAWYALPSIDAEYTFNIVDACVYNIFKSGSGELISGRAVNAGGSPIAGVSVTAQNNGISTRYAITDSKGVYAFVNLPSSRTYTIKAAKPPHAFTTRYRSTGRSSDFGACGNVWGVDFVSSSASPPTAQAQNVSAISGTPKLITLEAVDDNLPNPPGKLDYTVETLPKHGHLTDPSAGRITAAPYTLAGGGNQVEYVACSYYAGSDSFEFAADDGGMSPAGGLSAAATISIDTENTVETTLGESTGSSQRWPMRVGYDDSRTQVIYLSSEIGEAGKITGLALNVTALPAKPLDNWTIRIKHTYLNAYSESSGWETSGWTMVYRKTTTVNSTGWTYFEFTTPFEYNGTSNLMVDFSHNGNSWASPSGECEAWHPQGYRVFMAYAESTHGDPLNWNMWNSPPMQVNTMVPRIRLSSTTAGDELEGDFEVNCSVDIADLSVLMEAWLSRPGDANWDPACNISGAVYGIINQDDFAAFADKWLDQAN